MKLSFMTWVCPEWTVEGIIDGARKYGYEGVEIRVQSNQKHGIDVDTDPHVVSEAVSRFRDAGVDLPCVATSFKFSSNDPDERSQMVEGAKSYVLLAERLGAPYMRVFGGAIPDGVGKEECKKYVAESLHELGEFAADHGVTIALETHDHFSLARDVADTLRWADHPHVKCLWDFAHPFRHGETIEESFGYIRDQIVHTHVHDMTIEPDGRIQLAPMGEGEVPHDEAVRLLATIGFGGYLSGEWIGWRPPDEVLGHEAEELRRYIAAAQT